jgi:hypothetical protein
LVSASAEQLAKKPASAGFFMDKMGVIHNPSLSFHSFFSISRIGSPQTPQNLVNYHPIFCPNAGDCSFFVCFVFEQECRSTLSGLYN